MEVTALLKSTHDPRAQAVIDKVAKMLNRREASRPAILNDCTMSGQGFAYVHYKHSETYAAIAMEVVVNPVSGKVNVKRATCAHDRRQISNPDGPRNQVEGNFVQALSRALHEEVTSDGNQITSVD